jgi:hypothetical protein
MSPVQELTRATGDRSLAGIVVRCMACGRTVSADRPVGQCDACGGLLDVELTFEGPVGTSEFGVGLPPTMRTSGVWRDTGRFCPRSPPT